MKTFNFGDRVRVTDLDQTDGRMCKDTGEVIGISSDAVLVKCDHWANNDQPGSTEPGIWFFPHQCKKLCKKKKRVSITREELADAWDVAHINIPGTGAKSPGFKSFCKALGMGEEKKG